MPFLPVMKIVHAEEISFEIGSVFSINMIQNKEKVKGYNGHLFEKQSINSKQN